MKKIQIEKIIAVARSGSEIGDTILEATILALTENRVVVVTHNKMKYTISPRSIVEFIIDNREINE